MAKFGKTYATKEEYEFRFGVFKQNLKNIKEHDNSTGIEVGINSMADWTQDEYQRVSQSHKTSKRKLRVGDPPQPILPTDNLPASVDWRSAGKVTPPKRQGHCGSCYAFVSAAALESYHLIKN